MNTGLLIATASLSTLSIGLFVLAFFVEARIPGAMLALSAIGLGYFALAELVRSFGA